MADNDTAAPPPPSSRVTAMSRVEFRSNHDIDEWCRLAQIHLHDLHTEIAWAATAMRAALSSSKGVLRVDVKIRARVVTAPLFLAAEGIKLCGGLIVQCNGRFRHHFSAELDQAGAKNERPRFKFTA